MPYYRVRPTYATSEADDYLTGEGAAAPESDLWPGGRSRPFVLLARKAWQPPTDIYETASDVVIKMEVAGLHEATLAITIQDDVLSVRGRRVDDTGRHKIGYHHMGINYGEFASDIRLPGPIDQAHVRAEYNAGFLTIWLPKLPPRAQTTVRVVVTE